MVPAMWSLLAALLLPAACGGGGGTVVDATPLGVDLDDALVPGTIYSFFVRAVGPSGGQDTALVSLLVPIDVCGP
jgi:hypothetical protein